MRIIFLFLLLNYVHVFGFIEFSKYIPYLARKRKYTDENEELSGYRKGVSVTGKLFYVLFILFLLQSLDFSTMND